MFLDATPRTKIKNENKERILRTKKLPEMEQMFFNEITGHFNLREPKSNRPSSIFFVVSLDKKQYKIPTGVRVYPSMWDKEKEECFISFRLSELDNYNNSIANERISKIREQFMEFKLYLCAHYNEVINKIDILRSYINKDMQERVMEQNIVSFLTNSILNDAEVCGGTEKNYIKIVNAVGKFLKYKGTSISFKEFATTDMFDELRTYLKDIHTYRGKPLARSTINDYMQNAKGLLRYAVKAKFIDKVSVDNIVLDKLAISSTKENQIFLRNDEITKLYNYRCENEKDEVIKDVFLLECLTGQRISDTKKLSDGISNQFGIDEITLVQKKTNKKIRCNLIFDMAKRILEKYDYEVPRITPRSDSDSAYADMINKYIRKIAKEAGINGDWTISTHLGRESKARTTTIHRYEAIHSHTGRHTFICLLLLRGWNTFQIMKYSGHKNTKMIEVYAASMSPMDFEIYKKQVVDYPELIVKTIGEAENGVLDDYPQNASSNVAPKKEISKERNTNVDSSTSLKEIEELLPNPVKDGISLYEYDTDLLTTEMIEGLKDGNEDIANLVKEKYQLEDKDITFIKNSDYPEIQVGFHSLKIRKQLERLMNSKLLVRTYKGSLLE